MNKYPRVRELLAGLFGSEVGLPNEEGNAMYRDSYENEEILRQEIKEAFADESLSWMEMLKNEEYEVEETSSEEEARRIAKSLLIPE